MCEIDLDPADVWSEGPRRARKEHNCSACGDVIRVGQAYLYHFSISDREPATEKCCYRCWAAREEFAQAHGDRSFMPGMLIDMLSECIAERDPGFEHWEEVKEAILNPHLGEQK
jgi:hypothetical protein